MIFHLAFRTDWEAAAASGEYTISSRDKTLAEEGFIHASTAEQWRGVRDRFYSDVPADDLLLLTVNPEKLDVRYEPPAPGIDELFPHIYGPIPVSAVTATADLPSS